MKSKTLIFGHRGAPTCAPENTMPSFLKAYEQGADGIEIDVQFSKDHHIMVHHDFTLGRCEDGEGRIKDYTYFELRKLDLGSKFSKEFEKTKMPCIEEVLEFCKEKDLFLNIEIKTGSPYDPGLEDKLVEIVERYGMKEKVIYSSFNHFSLGVVSKYDKDAKVAPLTACAMINPWEYLKMHDFTGYHTNYLTLNKKIIDKLHHKDLFVNAYTVNSKEYMHMLIEANVDGIITNYPEVAVAVRDHK